MMPRFMRDVQQPPPPPGNDAPAPTAANPIRDHELSVTDEMLHLLMTLERPARVRVLGYLHQRHEEAAP